MVDDGLVVVLEGAELVVEETAVVVDPVEALVAFVVLDTVVGTEYGFVVDELTPDVVPVVCVVEPLVWLEEIPVDELTPEVVPLV